MKTTLFTENLTELRTEALIIGLYDDCDSSDVESYENISDGLISHIIKDKEFTGKYGQISIVRTKKAIKRIILLGLGKRNEFDLNKARELAGKAALFVKDKCVKEFSFLIFEDLMPGDAAYAIVEGTKLALYQFIDFKTQDLEDFKQIEQFTLVANGNNFIDIDKAIKKALVVSDAIYYVRGLQNKPSNIVTPTYLANEAIKLARRFQIKCTIFEKKDLVKMGMGGILAVNKGSQHPLKFIVLDYNGGKETICFVGKGITFDSGGISIKPAADMDEMKFDMSGAATVFGIIQLAAILKLPYRIIGLIPATENLPGGNAYKPGDIIKHYNGKTSEIINTDAEGRLVLADALAYTKNYNPKVVIDFATLTGACVVSLGDVYTGLFTNSNELANKLSEAGEKSGELVWRLPLHDKYKDYIKSNVADLKNAGPRDAGANTAAVFLKEFVQCKNWAHLDIAGTAWTKNGKDPIRPVGGTGVGVRLALEFLENWKK